MKRLMDVPDGRFQRKRPTAPKTCWMNATRASESSTAIRGITVGQPTGTCFDFTISDSLPPNEQRFSFADVSPVTF